LRYPSKFQRGSLHAFVTIATSLTGGQPNFARCLAISWAPILYYVHIFGGSCPLTEFGQVQNSRYVQVLRSSTLAALLHGTPAAGVDQTLWHGTGNGIMELSQRARHIFGWAAITLGIGPHSSSIFFLFSSPNLSRCRLDVCHSSTHGVALVQIYDAGLKRAAGGSLKYRMPLDNFVGLYLRN